MCSIASYVAVSFALKRAVASYMMASRKRAKTIPYGAQFERKKDDKNRPRADSDLVEADQVLGAVRAETSCIWHCSEPSDTPRKLKIGIFSDAIYLRVPVVVFADY